VSQGENAPTVTSDDVADLPLVGADEDSGEPVDSESAGMAPDDPDAGAGQGPEAALLVGADEDSGEPVDSESAGMAPDDPDAGAGQGPEAVLSGEVEGSVSGGDEDGSGPEAGPADLEQESEIAADYVEGLLDVADLDGDIDMDVEGDRALVSVVGATLQELIGPRGEVLEALQELTRLAVHRQTGMRTRIMLDVGGYRVRRRAELTELGKDAVEEVRSSGVPKRLSAMTPFERKVVHDAVAAAGLRSESEGEEPNRRVVVFPAG
jgi:spoIIIJ-associated protein